MPYSMRSSWSEEDGNKEANACFDKRLSVDERLRTFISVFYFPSSHDNFMTLNSKKFRFMLHTNRK